ncbi:hypothetical protein EJ05DRAFT_82611 [Pseudovirgaria hyperparasitica]|uniref:Fork-head domain-containing protein n=1 Tax=Pseudovirgaria hyperparasitica TaxID=470096 RepID=A0A6A6W4F9_9PEZI|nr:uncharacterized protein EJ05DRAFT_82611 [Pseudovirgaria hyperparasitica]KAF2755931.1 hypothetical protein EJ05DRAFT_82611 [Pseudovirgaria hyperparasitica]
MSCSTGRTRSPLFDIYKDVDFDLCPGPEDSAICEQLGPLTSLSYEHQNIFGSPCKTFRAGSPHKSSDHPWSSPRAEKLSSVDVNAFQIAPPDYIRVTMSPTKKNMPPPRKCLTPVRRANTLSGHQETSLAAIFPPLPGLVDQENVRPTSTDAIFKSKFEIVMEKKPIAHKRSFTDGSANPRNAKKQKVQEDEGPIEVPEPEDMPAVSDPGGKPDYSYANLIGMSLLRAPGRRLTLSQIYKWISDNYSYYSPTDSGWQNSIRHNLSLNKNFIKQDRPKEDPGKGHYWTIQPGQEHVFLKEKQVKRPASISLPSSNARPSTSSSAVAPPPAPLALPTKHVDASKFPTEQDLSSDATIPCSDPAIHDGHDFHDTMPPPSRALQSSPPPADIRSSPPAPPSRHSIRDESPLRLPPPLSSQGRVGTQKRKCGTLGDSGYYSSIESSAAKQRLPQWPLTSEGEYDLPPRSLKQGRAELEIARIRSSSHDSPRKPALLKKSLTFDWSSPFRPFDKHIKRGAPLTPPVIFKRPAIPPASASPNTNLANHRHRIAAMQCSPEHVKLFQDIAVASPSENFTLYEDHASFDAAFDVFNQDDFSTTFAARGSPEKRSVKRPRLFERATTSTGPLATITGSKANLHLLSSPNIMSSPSKFLQDPDELADPHFFDTPKVLKPAPRLTSASKGSISFSPLSSSKENLFRSTKKYNRAADLGDDLAMFPDLASDGSEEGCDIMQGFQKIGARPMCVAANGSPVKGPRPTFGRSTTPMF